MGGRRSGSTEDHTAAQELPTNDTNPNRLTARVEIPRVAQVVYAHADAAPTGHAVNPHNLPLAVERGPHPRHPPGRLPLEVDNDGLVGRDADACADARVAQRERREGHEAGRADGKGVVGPGDCEGKSAARPLE